jgi:micrococcal nuclease
VVAGCAGVPSSQRTGAAPTPAIEGETVTVSEVVDGDTMRVEYADGRTETVRLLGVDAPETHAEVSPAEFEGVPDTPAGRAWLRSWGVTASAFATERLAGRQVEIATDPRADRRGGFGRLLVYVTVDGVRFNRALLDRGYARLYDTDFSRRAAFADAERTAREDAVGLWGFDTAASGGQSAIADGPLRLVAIQPNAPGNDHENRIGEYLTVESTAAGSLDLAGWSVSDAGGNTYTVPEGTTLAPGDRLTLYSGAGTANASALYWDHDGAVWNNAGDTVIVRNATGSVVLRHEY